MQITYNVKCSFVNVHHSTDVILCVSLLVGYFSLINLISLEIVLALMSTYIALFSIRYENISYVLLPVDKLYVPCN